MILRSARADQRPIVVVVLLALAIKAIVLAQLHDHPLLRPEGGLDAEYYYRLALRVTDGDLLLGPDAYFVSPLYIYFVALLLAVSGGSLLAVKAAQITLGAVAVALVFLTARRWFRARTAIVAATLAALTGQFTFYETLVLQTALDPFLTALDLFLLARALDRRRPGAFAAAGAAVGIHALNRPNVLIVAAVVALLLVQRMRLSAAFVTGVALALAPVTLRNWTMTGEPVLITSHGGLNFYIGNHAEADGTYRAVAGITPDVSGQAADAERVAEAALGREPTAGEVSRYFYGRAWRWIRDEPAAAAGLLARKIAYVFSAAPIALNYSYEYYARDERTLLRYLIAGPWLLLPLGLIGLAAPRAPAAPRGYVVWASFVPAYALSIAVFFVASRYRLPLLIPLCVTAGAAIDWSLARGAARDYGRLAWAAAATAVLFAAVNRDVGLDSGLSEERTAMAVVLVEQGRGTEAERLVSRAAPDHPQPGLLHFRVGDAYYARRQYANAIEHFQLALHREAAPDIRFRLGQALLDDGRAAEAVPHLHAAYEAGVGADVAGFDLARALVRAGRAADAAPLLTRVTASPDLDARELVAWSDVAIEAGRPDLARRILDLSVERDPAWAPAHAKLGVALGLLGDPAAAVEHLERAVRWQPTDAAAHLNLAVVYAELGRIDEARARVHEALRLRPDYPQAQALLARLTIDRRRPSID
jgi:tetratricopeptide (TPR) repeat protein